MRYLVTGVVAVMLAWATPVKAQETSSEFLYFCDHDMPSTMEASLVHGYCLGFIAGWRGAETLLARHPDLEGTGIQLVPYCVPDAATTDQLRLVWLRYLEMHPEELHETPIFTFISSLRDAFPCP